MTDVASLKDQGNKAFAAKDYDTAISLFTQAIKLDPLNYVLYSNRSAARAGKKQWDDALEDAESCIKINPNWSKGYARKGAALHGSHRWDDAIAAYEQGLKIDESPALRKGLKEVQEARDYDMGGSSAAASDALGLGKMFQDPNLWGKLAANPKTQKHLADPQFVQKLRAIQSNPRIAEMSFGSDPRMIDVMGVLLGIDMTGYAREPGSDDLPPGLSKEPPPGATPIPTPSSASASASTSSHAPPPPAASSSNNTNTTTTQKTSQPEEARIEEPEEEDEEAKLEKANKKKAEDLKKIGNESYKARQFEKAADSFTQAWDLWPKDITFLTNLAAVQFEQGQYDKCIETCEKAVDEGRSLRADYKLIAKALGRIGTAYSKKNEPDSAIKFFEKSLSEHRTPDILNKLREVEKQKAEADRLAYINPELSEKAREEGNAMFKNGDFAGAVKAYTESINRDPKDPRGYNNRALCYTKLAALPEALKDAEEAIKVDPKFVKAYIRKSTVLFSMREYDKALEAVQEASEHDTENKNSKEVQEQLYKCTQALYSQRAGESEEETIQRAMRDPEVANIMNDPVMQQILQQAQQNPGALQDHMKNPVVRNKIQKLVSAGIIKTSPR